jgi:PAS domain S-box-containing protein
MALFDETTSRSTLTRHIAISVVVFAGYFVAGRLGQATTSIRSSNLGPVWPAYGVALAAFLIYNRRALIGIACGMLVVALLSPVSHVTAAGQAAGSTLAAFTGAALLRYSKFDASLSRLRDVVGLIVFGALTSAMISASIGVSVLYATGVEAYSGLLPAWLIYWLGDGTGVLLVTPLILSASSLLTIRHRDLILESVVLLLLLILACFVIFGDLPLIPVRLHFLAFAVLPFILWAAVRFGVSGVAVCTLLVATIATIETALGSGPFAQHNTFTNAVLLDVFFTVLSVSGLTLAAVIAEREQAERERERLVREQATVEARLRLAAIVESSEDAIIGENMTGTITDWNTGAERLYGYSADEAVGQPISLVLPEVYRGFSETVRTSGATSHWETVHEKKDGTHIEVSLSISPILDVEGRIVGASAIARDVTERKRTEQARLESEDKLRLILDSTAEAIYGLDVEHCCTFCNPACLRALGYESVDQLLGRNMHEAMHYRRLDGTPMPKEECRIGKVLSTAEGVHLDEAIFWRADGTSFPAECWVYPQKKADKVIGAVVAFIDISQRKQAESQVATLRDELLHLGRVTILDALTGSIAHEINQPLTAVMANTEAALRLAMMQPMPVEDLREALSEIRADNQRAGEVVQRLRTLLKKGATHYEPIDINSAVHEVAKLALGNALSRRIRLDILVSTEVAPVLADRIQFQQVVLNLLINAFDAVQEQEASFRRVTLRTFVRDRAAVLEVHDFGLGLSDSELPRVFEAFYSTKNGGMGLGLSICKAIVGAHGGTIDAVRNPGRGMTFSVTYPFWKSVPNPENAAAFARGRS